MPELPKLLRLGEAAARLGWSRDKLRKRLDANPPGVQIGGQWLPLRSVQEGEGLRHPPGQRRIREDDVAAVREAIDRALT